MSTEVSPALSGSRTPHLDRSEVAEFEDGTIPPESPRSPLQPLSLDIEPDDFDPMSAGPGFTHFSGTAGTIQAKFKAYTKLECLNAKDINALLLCFNICLLLSIAFCVLSIVLTRTIFSKKYNIPGLPPNLRVFEPALWFVRLESTLSFVLFGYSVFLFFAYLGYLLFHLVQYKERVSNEQVWVAMLLFSLMLYENPYEAIIRLGDGTFTATSLGRIVSIFFECVRMASFAFVSLLYVWFCSHSYRCLSTTVTLKDWSFYLPKVVLVLAYVVYKLFFMFMFGIAFSELPFASLFGAIQLYGTVNKWPNLGTASVALLTIFEAVLVGCILFDIYKTIQVHATADYLTFRTKQVGFRFFLHQNVIFYTAYVIIYAMVLFGFPVSIQVLLFFAGRGAAVISTASEGSYFDTQYAPFGLHLAVLAYATIEAFAGLPATAKLYPWKERYTLIGNHAESHKARSRTFAVNSLGSTQSSPRSSSSTAEPISYRGNEPDNGTVGKKLNCFTMATHIKLFNLSWYIYYYGTPKEQKLLTDLSEHNMQVVKCIANTVTDTRVIVLESDDRICVSFKGTSSSTNVSTDVKVVQMAMRYVVPTMLPLDTTPNAAGDRNNLAPTVPNTAAADVHELQQTLKYRRARIHVGFAKAYISVSQDLIRTIRDLLSLKSRPVLFCGHSLGGALATLCSADLVLQPWWGRLRGGESALVSTFGSPKVGNSAFQAVYNQLGISNWRVVAGGDVIARLPSVGYQHVGRKVVLSARGDLFVDPDALEARLWHRPAASIVHHRKATYLLALRGWCRKHHGNAQGFWDFPISKADSKRFHEAFLRGEAGAIAAVAPMDAEERARVRAARLKVWADRVDLLEPRSVHTEKMSGVELWARLTKPVLASVRAHDEALEADGGPLSIALKDVPDFDEEL